MGTNTFTIRDGINGAAKGQILGNSAAKFMAEADGHWRPYKTKTENKNCFVVDVDCVYTIPSGFGGLIMYFWEGDILVPENV